ncbi:hypothetical protein [Megasphaera elsdenii]|jgi:hypothetical protein|uniref:hypothetical protein n=1 Tax=Megasphaera elsdenii TaxID=907 RepID=UPI002A7F9127|nr:hypothetical protein [Megasphaera elsdenii]MCI7200470.1 hypothetical protein [Megasphaera elsdenii]MDY4265585.1 hypothetical protein [Megasphaera elsdenii]
MTQKEKKFLKDWYYGVYLAKLRAQKKSKTDKSKDLRIRKLRAETMVIEAEYVLMNLMPTDDVLPGLREKAEEEAGLY